MGDKKLKLLLKKRQVSDLRQVYTDLEKIIRGLKSKTHNTACLYTINIPKLISNLSHSKKKLERKITNYLLIEKRDLKKKIQSVQNNIKQTFQ